MMFYETGIVFSVEGDAAWVYTHSKSSCSSCKVSASCGSGVLEKHYFSRKFLSKAKNELHVKPGDEVIIAISKVRVTQACLIAYVVPLIGLLAGAVLSDIFFQQETHNIACGLLGLFLGFLFTKSMNKSILQPEVFLPKIINKTESSTLSQLTGSIGFKPKIT